MSSATARQRLREEIARLPDSQVEAVYDLVQGFRRAKAEDAAHSEILSLGGSWSHLSAEEFGRYLDELAQRRKLAGQSRRRHATSTSGESRFVEEL